MNEFHVYAKHIKLSKQYNTKNYTAIYATKNKSDKNACPIYLIKTSNGICDLILPYLRVTSHRNITLTLSAFEIQLLGLW